MKRTFQIPTVNSYLRGVSAQWGGGGLRRPTTVTAPVQTPAKRNFNLCQSLNNIISLSAPGGPCHSTRLNLVGCDAVSQTDDGGRFPSQ